MLSSQFSSSQPFSSSSEHESLSQQLEFQHFQQPNTITAQRKPLRRFPPEFLANLPDGVTYNDPARRDEKDP
jgi:hypothetical protein